MDESFELVLNTFRVALAIGVRLRVSVAFWLFLCSESVQRSASFEFQALP